MTLLKGALVAFTPTFLVPLPNVTVFQFNPESLTHTWGQPTAPDSGQGACGRPGTAAGNPLAVPGMPTEEFSLTVIVDANEDIAAGGVSGGLASATGLYTRLSAMEMLMYPATGGAMSALLGQATAALGLGGGGSSGVTRTVPDSCVPVVLFVWGPFRIVPVRLTAMTTTEKLYDSALNPVHAEVRLTLKVMTPAELQAAGADGDVLSKLATVAYTYTLGVRQAGAAANLANAAQSIVGMLPH